MSDLLEWFVAWLCPSIGRFRGAVRDFLEADHE